MAQPAAGGLWLVVDRALSPPRQHGMFINGCLNLLVYFFSGSLHLCQRTVSSRPVADHDDFGDVPNGGASRREDLRVSFLVFGRLRPEDVEDGPDGEEEGKEVVRGLQHRVTGLVMVLNGISAAVSGIVLRRHRCNPCDRRPTGINTGGSRGRRRQTSQRSRRGCNSILYSLDPSST